MAALMLAAVLHVADGTTTEWNGMQRSGMQWNGGEEKAAICMLPYGIGHKKHDKPPTEKHFFLPLLCITLDARPLPFLSLYRGLTETSSRDLPVRH